jgi:hypothetical protein
MNFALLLRVWLIVSLSLITGVIIWQLAPILFVIALVAAGLGVASFAMIALARQLQRRRSGRN